MKRNHRRFVSGLAAAILGAALWGLSADDAVGLLQKTGLGARSAVAGSTSAVGVATAERPGGPEVVSPFGSGSAVHHPEPVVAAAAPAPDQAAAAGSPLDTIILPTFQANADGGLELTPQTLIGVERIHALFSEEAGEKLAAHSTQLPPAAQRELAALYQVYTQYAQAQSQSLPPAQDGEPTLAEARRELHALKQLRRQYFGEPTAEALFGHDERAAAEMAERMLAK